MFFFCVWWWWCVILVWAGGGGGCLMRRMCFASVCCSIPTHFFYQPHPHHNHPQGTLKRLAVDDATLAHPEQTAELPLTPAPSKGGNGGKGKKSIFLFSGPRCGVGLCVCFFWSVLGGSLDVVLFCWFFGRYSAAASGAPLPPDYTKPIL